MITNVRLDFAIHHIEGGVRAVLEQTECGPDVAEHRDVPALRMERASVLLNQEDPRLARLLQLLTTHHEGWLEWRWDEYTDDELLAAPLLVMAANTDNDVFGGPRVGTSYDMSQACRQCGAGAIQTSAMFIEGEARKALKKSRAVPTYYNDILVDNALADELVALGAKGLSFREVYLQTKSHGAKAIPWKQLCASHIMPPMQPEPSGLMRLKKACTACKRSGTGQTIKEPLRIAYRMADLAEADDINVTWEWFGDTAYDGDVSDALLPYPLHLITPRLFEVFRKAKVIGFDFIPIRVVDR